MNTDKKPSKPVVLDKSQLHFIKQSTILRKKTLSNVVLQSILIYISIFYIMNVCTSYIVMFIWCLTLLLNLKGAVQGIHLFSSLSDHIQEMKTTGTITIKE